jgi:hypothetical protein
MSYDLSFAFAFVIGIAIYLVNPITFFFDHSSITHCTPPSQPQ